MNTNQALVIPIWTHIWGLVQPWTNYQLLYAIVILNALALTYTHAFSITLYMLGLYPCFYVPTPYLYIPTSLQPFTSRVDYIPYLQEHIITILKTLLS